MKRREKNARTQWAGQFAVALELTRRNYLVAFTLGNTPDADLLCTSPSGKPFAVQVKSLSSKTYYLCQDRLLQPNKNLFFIFVFIPIILKRPPEFFILNNSQFIDTMRREEEYMREKEQINDAGFCTNRSQKALLADL